jgi:DNA invertase Pin-like site-specific DNA recombinase
LNYGYIIENTTQDYIDNSTLFKMINDLDIGEDEIYVDTYDSKEQLDELLSRLEPEDRLVIRSVVDLSDEAKQLLLILSILKDNQIILCSVNESFLNGTDYYDAMRGFAEINSYYLEKRRQNGFQSAKEKGTVGRPAKTEEIERAIRLYNTKSFSTAEIERMCGISSSSLYRALQEEKKEKI